MCRKAYLKLLPNGDYVLVVSQGSVMLHYLSSQFLTDVICGVPWELGYNLYLQVALGINPQDESPTSLIRKAVVYCPLSLCLRVAISFHVTRVSSAARMGLRFELPTVSVVLQPDVLYAHPRAIRITHGHPGRCVLREGGLAPVSRGSHACSSCKSSTGSLFQHRLRWLCDALA